MSNRIAVFNDGVIQQLAPPEGLYEAPENAFVAQFIGENNRLRGTLEEVSQDSCAVRVEGGDLVHALPVNVDSKDSVTTLSLRPERVTVRPPEGEYKNVFQAEVLELIYLGDHVRTRVSLLGHEDFIIKIPNAYGHQQLRVGERVPVGWHARDCRALNAA